MTIRRELILELKAREMGCTLSQQMPRPGEPDFPRMILLFAFPEDIRKVIYTTNAIESLTMTLRKVTRNQRIFPSDEAVYKVV